MKTKENPRDNPEKYKKVTENIQFVNNKPFQFCVVRRKNSKIKPDSEKNEELMETITNAIGNLSIKGEEIINHLESQEKDKKINFLFFGVLNKQLEAKLKSLENEIKDKEFTESLHRLLDCLTFKFNEETEGENQ